MRFIIESSATPIYDRIAIAITRTLRELGHEAIIFKALDFEESDFINTINALKIDYYIVTNDNNYINKKSKTREFFLFEKIYHKIIFIHHDSSFCKPETPVEINRYLAALISEKERSFHFFIEKSNINLFHNIGINHAYPTLHASEFTKDSNPSNYHYHISFVGHLMSSLKYYPIESLHAGHHMASLAWSRLSNSEFNIQNEICRLRDDPLIHSSIFKESSSKTAEFQFLMHEITKLSMAYRGDLINSIKNNFVDIIGGDLSYGTMNDPLLKLCSGNVKYHPATQDYNQTKIIYNQTKINLNISSLQFDSAINNRIVDIVLSGGFLLTDNRSDLTELCPTTKFISYNSPEHLNFLIQLYSDPTHNNFYNDVKEQIYLEFANVFNYGNTIQNIIEKIPH